MIRICLYDSPDFMICPFCTFLFILLWKNIYSGRGGIQEIQSVFFKNMNKSRKNRKLALVFLKSRIERKKNKCVVFFFPKIEGFSEKKGKIKQLQDFFWKRIRLLLINGDEVRK